MNRTEPTVIAGALGNCVHVAGVLSFLNLARSAGYKTIFLGPAVSVEKFAAAVAEHDPELVAVSYRLTPSVAKTLIEQLQDSLRQRDLLERRFVFGGTAPVAQVAQASGLFEKVFSGGESPDEVFAYLRGETQQREPKNWGTSLRERLAARQPYPLLRHHFGQPEVAVTVEGAQRIAEAEVLDILSLGPDQNAQESFFRPDEMKPEQSGAGGVALRSPDDLRAIYQATRCGNYPLLRCYSGTRDLINWAEMSVETINNAWGAIPLCWYNTLDRLAESMPSSTWLTRISTGPVKEDDEDMVLSLVGVSPTQARVGETMMRLSVNPDFQKIDLHFTRKTCIGLASAIEFEIGATMTTAYKPKEEARDGNGQS